MPGGGPPTQQAAAPPQHANMDPRFFSQQFMVHQFDRVPPVVDRVGTIVSTLFVRTKAIHAKGVGES